MSAHNAFLAAGAADEGARAERERAFVRAARAGVGAARIAAAIGVGEAEVGRIVAHGLG